MALLKDQNFRKLIEFSWKSFGSFDNSTNMFAIFVIRFFFSKEINKSGSKYNCSIPTCVWKCEHFVKKPINYQVIYND